MASDPSRPDGHGGGEVAADHGGVAMWRGGRGRDGRHEAEVRAERERRLLEMTPGSSLVFHPGVHESLQALEKGEVRSRLKGHRDRLKIKTGARSGWTWALWCIKMNVRTYPGWDLLPRRIV